MTEKEFKAWFEGFCEGIEGIPNEKQWEKIKEKIAQLTPEYIQVPSQPYTTPWIVSTNNKLPGYRTSAYTSGGGIKS